MVTSDEHKKPHQVEAEVDVSRAVRSFGSLSAAALGWAYASGFLIFQIHLGQIGVVLYGPFSLTYLIAGALFTFSVALVWIPAWRGEFAVRAHVAELRKKGEGSAPFYKTLAIRVLSNLISWVLPGLVLNLVGLKFAEIFSWILGAYVGHVFLRFIWLRIVQDHNVPWGMRFLFAFPMVLALWIGLCGNFALSVYPNIYREIGGGRPVAFELRIKEETQVPSGIYDVLAVTDRYWIVKKPSTDEYVLLRGDTIESAAFRGPIRLFRQSPLP